jgi:hypothetical protein
VSAARAAAAAAFATQLLAKKPGNFFVFAYVNETKNF